MSKKKVYMVSDWYNGDVHCGPLNLGIEYMGDVSGRLLSEEGEELGRHHSSSFGWLRSDLKNKLDNLEDYEIIDLIGEEVPDKFKIQDV